MDYRAKCKSFGFRKQYWEVDDIAKGVDSSERIPLEHFEAISQGEVKEDAKPVVQQKPKQHKPKAKGEA